MTDTAPRADWRRPARLGYASVFVLFGIGGAWASIARLDSAATANGTVTVQGDRKSVQHLEGGTVTALPVVDGQRVAEGQLLVRLDSIQAEAGRSGARSQYLTALADEARWSAESSGARSLTFPAELVPTDPEAARAMAESVRAFHDHEASLSADVAVLGQKAAQAAQERLAAQAKAKGADLQVASIEAELASLRPLVERGLVARTRVTQLDRSRLEQEASSQALRAEMTRLDREVEGDRMQAAQVAVKARDEASVRLADARARIVEARQKGVVSGDMVKRSEVRASRAGRIVNMKLHGVGQVVRPGETFMEIVPEADTLVVTARMAPSDAVRVAPGLAAEVRLPAFKSRTTPVAVGEVISVSADAIQDETGRQPPYYEVKVSVSTATFPAEVRAKLRPGLPADVMVATGERTVLAYLLQPLGDAVRHGMRED